LLLALELEDCCFLTHRADANPRGYFVDFNRQRIACMSRCSSFGSVSIAWLMLCSVVLADGVLLNGVSPRALSRGGTNLAFSDNGGILFDNPAGMTNIDDCALCELAGVLPITTMHYVDAQNDVWSTDATPLPQVSYIRKSEDGVWAFGLGLFVPAGFVEDYTMQGPPQIPGERRFESFGVLTKILPGVACQVTDQLSIGTLHFARPHAAGNARSDEHPRCWRMHGVVGGRPISTNRCHNAWRYLSKRKPIHA
jgi:hypothetical protein